ncbi:uncharacterized protein WCC33_013286 [Rhinophrynus dorsalis]
MASADLREELNCSICLSVYTDPVMLRCGHNFCRVCIRRVLDSQEKSGVYSCPECREEFQERPALQRNIKLCNIVERFLSTHPDQDQTVIFCTYCVRSPVPAVKTCLHCETSLCDTHLSAHNKSVEHVLTEPTTFLEKKKCCIHNNLLKYYCSEDGACICVSCCVFGEHRGHQVGWLHEASEKKMGKLKEALEKLTLRREETEKRVQSLQEHRKEIQGKSASETERVTALFKDIREQLEALEQRVLSEISRQEEEISLQVSGLIQRLEIKKDELSRKIRHIEELSNITDPLTFLQGWGAVGNGDEEGDNEDRERDDKEVPTICDLDEAVISLTLHIGLADILTAVKKGTYVQEATDILLDKDTAASNVLVSGDLKMASSAVNKCSPKKLKRFESHQVLGTRSFNSGKHYWVVDTSESGLCRFGVAYPSMEMKGNRCIIGNNTSSWCFYINNKLYQVIHDSERIPLHPKLPCRNLGIFLDYEAGRLSFYQLCDPIVHLYTFTATFTEPLHPVFAVGEETWVRIRRSREPGMASADLKEELNCSICLSVYTDPVTLRCGHNFCLGCIKSVLNTQKASGVYFCPDCRAEFQERPALQRNMKLCNIVERFLSTHAKQETAGILCTHCIQAPVPAVKTCLHCEASLCNIHLRAHSKSEEHVLTDPTTSMENRKCSIHKEILKYYCSEDGACICVSCCVFGEHKGHQVDLLNQAFEKKKVDLKKSLDKLTPKREETEKRVHGLHERRREVKEKSVAVTERVTALFKDIREQLEALEKRVLSEIFRQEEQVSLQVSGLIQQLEMKKDELSRKIRHIEELCNKTDPLRFLHRCLRAGSREPGMASADLKEELNCSICLSIYTDPVTLRCGHNFCLGCIKSVLNTQKASGVYFCPDCRAEFQERPALQRNMKLCNIVERFLSTHAKQETAGILCTHCIQSPVPAVKTCLHCEASLCNIHLRAHSKSEEHVLTDPTTSMENRKCSIHKEILKYYCSEDGACICVSCCVFGEHKGHQVDLLNQAFEKKKVDLKKSLDKLTPKREETEKRVHGLHERRREVKEKSVAVTERVTALFKDIREQLEALEKRVLSEIFRQEEQVSLQVSGLIQQLEIKKDELSRKIRHIEELCNKTDPLRFLQEQEFYNSKDENEDREREHKKSPAVGDLDEVLISLTLHRGLADIVMDTKAKQRFGVQEASDLVLDLHSAHQNVVVSSDLKTVSRSEINQRHPRKPQRFKFYYQVLSTRKFSSGQHYWEVETSQSGGWKVGMSYPSIGKKGEQSWIGNNKVSWCLYMYSKEYSVIHDSKVRQLSLDSLCQRLGVYLDYEAGRLSFYQLCDPIRHLHTFTATFTEPLHAAFYVRDKGWVRIKS